jgi:hypothetical protein
MPARISAANDSRDRNSAGQPFVLSPVAVDFPLDRRHLRSDGRRALAIWRKQGEAADDVCQFRACGDDQSLDCGE